MHRGISAAEYTALDPGYVRPHAMILIGTMNLTRTRSTGDFYCPQCGSLREYRLRARRPFLTLYFIPLIPIGPAEVFVQCSTCKSNSPVVALEHDERSFREAQQSQFQYDSFQAALMVVLANGEIDENEIQVLLDLGTQLLPSGIDREQLGALCSSIRLNKITPKNFIVTVSRPWTVKQRRTAVQLIFLAASAGGEIAPEPMRLLSWLREHLGLSEAEYQAAIEDAIEFGVEE